MSNPPRPDPPPRKIDHATWWSYRQHRRQWVKRHGGAAVWPFLIAGTVGLLSGNAAVLLILLAVALVGTIWARTR